MDALILAAGMGSRIRTAAPCKPLVRVHDMPLIEIAIRQLIRAGATRIVIVLGYQADTIRQAIQHLEPSLSAEIVFREIDDVSRPNGYSVLAGCGDMRGPYLLVMADHILSSPVLEHLADIDLTGSDTGAVLAIDHNIASPLVDPLDATWVATDESGLIQHIGKHIAPYDAVDCGAFLATPALAEAISCAISKGMPGSLSDGMQILANEARAATVDIGDAWWIDVDDAHALALAQDEVRAHLPHLFADMACESAA